MQRSQLVGAAAIAATLLLIVPGAARAQLTYQAQVIMRAGDVTANVPIPANAGFQVGALNDAGHLAVVAGTPTNGALFQVADGQVTPIVAAGLTVGGITWPNPILIGLPVKMNDAGNLVFFTEAGEGTARVRTTYLWDRAARSLTPIAQRGSTGPQGLVWTDGGYFSPVLNNLGEIAFPAGVSTGIGRAGYGIFFRTATGDLSVVAAPGLDISDEAVLPSIDDRSRVTFLTRAFVDGNAIATAAYLWERGGRTRLAGIGTTLLGDPITQVTGAWLNNANTTALLLVHTGQTVGGPRALVRYENGALRQLVATGSEMPGGGQLRDIAGFGEAVSWADAAGRHAFVALLADGSQAAYILDASGAISLILREGAQTPAGRVTRIAPALYVAPGTLTPRSFGIALNARSQVVLPVELEGGVNAVLLLTPAGDGEGPGGIPG